MTGWKKLKPAQAAHRPDVPREARKPPHPVVELVEHSGLVDRVETIMANVCAHERVILLFDEAVIVLLPGRLRETRGDGDWRFQKASRWLLRNSPPLSGWISRMGKGRRAMMCRKPSCMTR
jgi:hypothetical protein